MVHFLTSPGNLLSRLLLAKIQSNAYTNPKSGQKSLLSTWRGIAGVAVILCKRPSSDCLLSVTSQQTLGQVAQSMYAKATSPRALA